MELAFFGLTSETAAETRAAIFTQIHEICFYSKGAYDWNTVYNMPIWLRRFTFSKIQDHFKEKSRQIEEASSSSKKSTKLVDSSGKVNTPEFLKASESYKKPAKYK